MNVTAHKHYTVLIKSLRLPTLALKNNDPVDILNLGE